MHVNSVIMEGFYVNFVKEPDFIIGNELIGTNNTCQVYKGSSNVKCNNCDGSGYIANWKKDK